MKINEPGRVGPVNPYKKAADNRNTFASGKAEKKKDQVEISPEAKELLEAQAADSKRDRIEELKKSVASGTYQVDARKLAERIFPFIKE